MTSTMQCDVNLVRFPESIIMQSPVMSRSVLITSSSATAASYPPCCCGCNRRITASTAEPKPTLASRLELCQLCTAIESASLATPDPRDTSPRHTTQAHHRPQPTNETRHRDAHKNESIHHRHLCDHAYTLTQLKCCVRIDSI